jgi:hypothetical protein
MTKMKKPKAAVGVRYDVILTDGGDQKIEVATTVVQELTARHRVAAELTELFDCPSLIMGRDQRGGGADQA